MNIEKATEPLEKTYQWYDEKYYKVPDVLNLTQKEANKLLSKFQIEYAGNGNIVKSQTPDAGSYIPEGSKIRLLLN